MTIRLPGLAIAGFAAAGISACGPSADVNTAKPLSASPLTVEQCLKQVGWQHDFVVDAEFNAITDAHGTMCNDATTATWYEEDARSDAFRQVMGWDTASTCGTRTPQPSTDQELCSFAGTHTFHVIPGIAPSKRMALIERVALVRGDFDGDGNDDKCGPAAITESTEVRYLAELDGDCVSGVKAWTWQSYGDEQAPRPGDMFREAQGTATPMVLCSSPGSVGPTDHLTGRKICPTSLVVSDGEG